MDLKIKYHSAYILFTKFVFFFPVSPYFFYNC